MTDVTATFVAVRLPFGFRAMVCPMCNRVYAARWLGGMPTVVQMYDASMKHIASRHPQFRDVTIDGYSVKGASTDDHQ